jgi:hypothetical protein
MPEVSFCPKCFMNYFILMHFVVGVVFIEFRLDNVAVAQSVYLLAMAERPSRSSSPGGTKNFHFSMKSKPALGSTQSLIQLLPGVKRQGREADHSSRN